MKETINRFKFFNFKEFLESQQSAGVILIFCTLFSLVLANSPIASFYKHFWETSVGLKIGNFELEYHLIHWINDGLMAIFFLFVGIEIKRELLEGELSSFKVAILPVLVALGGMIFPAIFYTLCNVGPTGDVAGFGIPMATDIAFALGALSLLGNKVPSNLKVFLMALAVIDDLGAIVVIAIFYGGAFSKFYILMSLCAFAILLLFNRLKVKSLTLYFIVGAFLWVFMLHSGIHATIAGVLLALALPFDVRYSENYTIPAWITHHLHRPINYFVMPVFAIANTAILINFDAIAKSNWSILAGIFTGLFFGKVLGIFLTTYFSVKLRLSVLPTGVTWGNVIGVGFLGGIGFTMSIFVTTLAFSDPTIVDSSKLIIILTSTLSGIVGYLYLKFVNRQ